MKGIWKELLKQLAVTTIMILAEAITKAEKQ